MTVLSMIAEDGEHSFTHSDIDKLIQKVCQIRFSTSTSWIIKMKYCIEGRSPWCSLSQRRNRPINSISSSNSHWKRKTNDEKGDNEKRKGMNDPPRWILCWSHVCVEPRYKLFMLILSFNYLPRSNWRNSQTGGCLDQIQILVRFLIPHEPRIFDAECWSSGYSRSLFWLSLRFEQIMSPAMKAIVIEGNWWSTTDCILKDMRVSCCNMCKSHLSESIEGQ